MMTVDFFSLTFYTCCRSRDCIQQALSTSVKPILNWQSSLTIVDNDFPDISKVCDFTVIFLWKAIRAWVIISKKAQAIEFLLPSPLMSYSVPLWPSSKMVSPGGVFIMASIVRQSNGVVL